MQLGVTALTRSDDAPLVRVSKPSGLRKTHPVSKKTHPRVGFSQTGWVKRVKRVGETGEAERAFGSYRIVPIMPKIGNFVFFAPKGTLVFFFCPFSFEPEGKLRWCLPYHVKMVTTAISGRLRKVNKSRCDLGGQTPPSARRSTHKDIQRRHTQSVWPRSRHLKNNNRIVQAGFREVVTPWHCLAYMLDKAKEDRPALPEDLEEIARDAVSEMGGGQLRAMASYEAEDATLYKAAVFRKDIKAMPASNYGG